MAKILILAGSYNQYLDFLDKNRVGDFSRQNTRNISRPRDLHGIENATIKYVGTFWENPMYDSHDLRRVIRLGRVKEL